MAKFHTRSGLPGWRDTLRNVYSSFEEFEAYDAVYALAKRLGYADAAAAWKYNPTVQGSVNPGDYRRVGRKRKNRLG